MLLDVRRHLVHISSLIPAGDPAAIARYIDRLLNTDAYSDKRIYCEHRAVDAVIGGCIGTAERQGIVVTVALELPQEIGIDKRELCALFGDVMENAIEACLLIPSDSALYARRYINVNAWVEDGETRHQN